MLSLTRRALEDFDNQHDFERFAADVLNALGYDHVEPMAPGGGADGGCDICFRDGDAPGEAFVTLEKKIRDKFQRDLSKQTAGDGLIALFCNEHVTPGLKLTFARKALAKGYRLEVYDIERLRSLLDSSLKEIRRRYLGIDDHLTAQLRSEIRKLLRFPQAIADEGTPPTVLETLVRDPLPRRLFDLLMRCDEGVVREVPSLGRDLHDYMTRYYALRQETGAMEEKLLLVIGTKSVAAFQAAWSIYLRYVLLRFAGVSQDKIVSWGSFLNYGITWEKSERVFTELSADLDIAARVSDLLQRHVDLSKELVLLAAKVDQPVEC